MKKIIIAVAFMLGVCSVNAQSFESGTKVLQVGIGVGGSFGTPISGAFEYGVSDKIGIQVGGGFTNVDVFGTYILINAGANYHFYTEDKFDAYAGLFLGYNKFDYSGFGSPSSTYFGARLGGRYYFSDSVGAFAELGYGLANLNVGVAFKF